MPMTKEVAAQVHVLNAEIMPMFSGVDPDVVGAVLGTLVATYFSGHHPETREAVRAVFDEMIDRIVALLDEQPTHPWRDGPGLQ